MYCAMETQSLSHAHDSKTRFQKKNHCLKTQFQFQSETLAHTDSHVRISQKREEVY